MDEEEKEPMQAPKDRTLRVIKGAKPATPGRASQRRLVTRRMPRPAGPIEDILERLDQEPVEDPVQLPEPVERPAKPTAADEPESVQPSETDEPEGEDAPEDRDDLPRRRTRDRRAGDPDGPAGRNRLRVGLLVVLLAAALAGAGVTGHRWYVDRATDQARQAALAAAKQTAVNFVSVSAASVDRDLQRVTAGATGDFKEEFTRGQAQVRAAVVENRVESHGSVLRAGLVSGDRRRAVVLVAVDATVKNVKVPDGRPSHYRIQMDLVRDGDSGRWLVSRLQFVG
ncbi:Mce-associated membrane protein [Micromonospora pallida]|uniref:Mce-associated membrane protein n=2 Tax=Micromonospora pallida TaxID=145854 RepID=A0A1C6SE77_9ACTN|nr:Mce-associated membrane protein [Micromonospora pallida]